MTKSEQIRKYVSGHKIVKVKLNRMKCGPGKGDWTYDPEIFLDNGVSIFFHVDEFFDGSSYGIDLLIVKPERS